MKNKKGFITLRYTGNNIWHLISPVESKALPEADVLKFQLSNRDTRHLRKWSENSIKSKLEFSFGDESEDGMIKILFKSKRKTIIAISQKVDDMPELPDQVKDIIRKMQEIQEKADA